MEDSIRKVLLTSEDIREKIIELSDRISCDYITKDLVVIGLLNGSVLFLADLIRMLDMPMRYDLIGVRSYYGSAESSGRIEITKELTLDVQGRDVLLIDDILDTGRTLDYVCRYIGKFSPRSLKTCVLLSKDVVREVEIQPDYTGFRVDDCFVVGYGLDYSDRYRNLPYIAVFRPSE
jgi:hypoxanthine phosphoribosyltransferase